MKIQRSYEAITAMNFGALDLNLLRVLDALMRERSVTRAGERIGLSQPAVSNALTRLRQILGDELFVRRGTDMVPTPRAEAIGSAIGAALAQMEEAVSADDKFEPATAERAFTFLGSDIISTLVMPLLSERVAARAPGIRLRLLDIGAGEMQHLLRDDVVDIAFNLSHATPEWISRQSVYAIRFAIIASPHNGAIRSAGIKSGRTLPLKLFCKLPHAIRSSDSTMRGVVDDALQKLGPARRVMLALPHFHAVAAAVARGHLIAAVPTVFAKGAVKENGLVMFKPPLPIQAGELFMYWHKRHDLNPAIRWMCQQVSEVWKTLELMRRRRIPHTRNA
jgi:DNA-binding transcriptional LysR family regulator